MAAAATNLWEEFFSAVIKSGLLAADVGTTNKPVDFVGDHGIGTGIAGICIAHITAHELSNRRMVEVDVNCNGQSNVFGTAWGATADTVLTFNDPRIGDVKVAFEDEGAIRYPWPGGPMITTDVYISAPGKNHQVGLQQLAPESGPKYVIIHNCKGTTRDVTARVAVHLKHSDTLDEYAVAFPLVGGDSVNKIACDTAN